MKLHAKILLILLLCTLIAAGCSRKENPSESTPEKQADPKPNVIIILVDTLRQDYVGAYGANNPTPVFDMLASQGAMFTRAYASSSWTVPSIASIFTGLYPQRHGLHEGMAIHVKVFQQQKMPDQYQTLAELFKGAGYTTFCVTTNAHIAKQYGYDQGFDHFQMFTFQDGEVLESKVEQWKGLLDKAAKTTGYFLFLHWLDPHHPYVPRDPYMAQIRPDYLDKIGRTLDDIGPEKLRLMGYFRDYPEQFEVLKDVYNSEVLWTDASVGRMLKILPDLGKSMVVFTSDHGEAFNEHDSMLHGYDLYQETVHVPLILIYPDKRGEGRIIDTPVSLVDLPPTLLAFAGIKPPEEYQGIDLTALINGGTIPERPLFFHLDKNKEYRWKGVIDEGMKYLQRYPSNEEIAKATLEGKKAPTRSFLFDLDSDSGEKRNLSGKRSTEASRLKSILEEEMGKPVLVEPEKVEDKVQDDLKELFRSHGYL